MMLTDACPGVHGVCRRSAIRFGIWRDALNGMKGVIHDGNMEGGGWNGHAGAVGPDRPVWQ